jgi:hypothetical protein
MSNFYCLPGRAGGTPNVLELEPELDTATVARIVLKELVAEGKDPSADWTNVHVSAWQDGFKGETGQSLVHVFGTTDYRYRSDSLEWRPWVK